jgi:bacterial/archaeal transporter family protein
MPVWIIWIILTLISWGIWAVLFRLIGDQISPAHSQAISTLGILPVMVALWRIKDAPTTTKRQQGVLFAFGSGLLSCLGNVACYDALKHAKAATVVPLTSLYPVVTVLLAVPLLKERLNLLQWIGIGFSLVAIYLFNVPEGADTAVNLNSDWIMLPLAAVVLWGITGVMQKAATSYISARSTAIWFLAAFLPVAVLIHLFEPLPRDISVKTWLLSAALGFSLALGNLTILLAFSSGGKASIIAPFAGLYPVVSVPIAIVCFQERLGWRESSGILLALVAVLLLSLQFEPTKATTSITKTDASI